MDRIKEKVDFLLSVLYKKTDASNLGRFLLIGSLSTLLNYSLFLLLFLFNVHYIVAAATGYIFGVIAVLYITNNAHIIFEPKKYSIELTKYMVIYTTSLSFGLVLLKLLVQYLDMHVLIANIFNILFTASFNFLGLKFFISKYEKYFSVINFLVYRYKYLLRYIAIGVGSIFVELLSVEIFTRIFNLIGVSSNFGIKFTGFLIGVYFAFFLNSRINFPVPKSRNMRTFKVFLTISLFSFLLNVILINYLYGNMIFLDYRLTRFFTASLVFILSYMLHRKFTFIDIKEVGIAVYVKSSENIQKIKSKVEFFPDFIHLDLVDKTYNPNAEKVNLKQLKDIFKAWPFTTKMIHVMSKKPSQWIEKVHKYVDYVIFHLEQDEDISDLIGLCKRYNKKVGMSILYSTNIESLIPYLSRLDLVQVLGIPSPGESAQNMNPVSLQKVELLDSMKKKYGYEVCFDGGVKLSNIPQIKAKYVVSGSAVLNSENPRKAIFDLKTSSKYYLDKDLDLKRFLLNEINRITKQFEFILSATLVGSFAFSKSLEGLSDIDIIIIIDKLSKQHFDTIINEFSELKQVLKVDYDYDLFINSSFGPLKFNKEKTVVFHIMIYDVEGHVSHCKNSPFTCLDWQNSDVFIKRPMRSVYAVTALQPNYFFSSRRGIKDYLGDIESGRISYREYSFNGHNIMEVKNYKPMENKDKFEFAYHIMKFLMVNFLKLYLSENKRYSNTEILQKYFKIFPLRKNQYTSYFNRLSASKNLLNHGLWTESLQKSLNLFVNDFKNQFTRYFRDSATKVFFMRHNKTKLNDDGVFLGIRSNPDIILPDDKDISKIRELVKENNITKLYSSPLNRCIQSLNLLKDDLSLDISVKDELIEIDYGLVDGKDYKFLKKNYPKIISAWEAGKDPHFPSGENTAEVLGRLVKFLSSLKQSPGEDYLVCTHNVVLRCLVGKYFNIPVEKWFLLKIPYLEPIEFILAKNGKFYPNLTDSQREYIFSGITWGDNN